MMAATASEGMVGIALCAAFADGVMESEEDDRLADALAGLPCLGKCSEEELQAAFVRADARARAEGEPALLRAAALAVPAHLKETAFFLGADIVLADGDEAREEHAFLEALRQALGLEPEQARRIVEVVCIRNRG